MSMSKDRVRFKLCTGNTLRIKAGSTTRSPNSEADRTATMHLLRTTLGLSRDEARLLVDNPNGALVVCRPSQFARFLIARNDQGFSNDFVNLEAKLFTPAACSEQLVFDTAGRPRSSYDEAACSA